MKPFGFLSIFIIIPLLFETSDGEYRKKNRLQKPHLTIPCILNSSVFLEHVCVKCIKRLRFIPKNCDQRHEAIHNPSCPRIVQCLRRPEDVEAFQIRQGAEFLYNRKLQVVTIERHPFVKVLKDGTYSGVCFELLYALQTKYNFTMKAFPPYDGNWGAETDNGTWNGMVGQVLRKEADLGVSSFSVTLQRSKVIAFSSSYYQEETAILIPPPIQGGGPKLTILVRPLSSLVWALLALTIFILAPALYFLHITSLWIYGKEREKKSFVQMIADLLHFMVGSLVQESVVSPVNKTTRFLIILWWFLTLIVANIYVAYLVSYLSAPKLSNVVDSLDDLVKQEKIKWTFRKNTAHQDLFKSDTSIGVYKLIGDGVSIKDLVKSDVEGIERVLTGKNAFIKEKSFLDVALGQDFLKTGGQCRITVAKETFFKVETALILQKSSKFLDLINTEITRSVTTGLMDKWKSIHWERLLWCEDAVSYIPTTLPKARKLGVGDLEGAWTLLGVVTLVSVISFLSELLCYKLTTTRISHTTQNNSSRLWRKVKVMSMSLSLILHKLLK